MASLDTINADDYIDALSGDYMRKKINDNFSALNTELATCIHRDGSVDFTADQSMGTHKITNIVDPTSAQHAATKNYVDKRVAAYAKAYASGAISLVDDTWTTVALATEVWDIGGDFASNTFTAPTAGKYQCIGQIAVEFGAANSRVYGRIYKNGTTAVIQAYNQQHLDSQKWGVQVIGEIVLAANDTIILQGLQNSGAAKDTLVGEKDTYLIVRRITE